MDTNQNPEALHEIAKDKTPPTTGAFVNAGIPLQPLVAEKDIPNPEISADASKALRDNLLK